MGELVPENVVANDFCLDVASGSELMLRNIILSPYISAAAVRLFETCLNNL